MTAGMANPLMDPKVATLVTSLQLLDVVWSRGVVAAAVVQHSCGRVA